MRKKIVAGNWKMNLTVNEGLVLIEELKKEVSSGIMADELIVFPPYIHLTAMVENAQNEILVGAQNCHQEENGAFTGEVSAHMLAASNIGHVLIGHSERRAYFNETNDLLAKKVEVALNASLTVVYCCGETLPEREENRHFEIIKSQLTEGLFHLTAEQMANVVIAYEPVWAIGTGRTASADQAQEVHAFIRKLVNDAYSTNIAQGVSILYGGSCNPTNANELFSKPDVDGGLIGGASLKAIDFIQIANAY